jgi:hypothetical protein
VAPERNLLVPAERHATSLMEWLPLPKRADGPAAGGTPFDARLRLREPAEPPR